MKRSIPFEVEGKLTETETIKWSKFPKSEKATVEKILGSER